MSAASLMRRVVGRQAFNFLGACAPVSCQVQATRNQWTLVKVPDPNDKTKQFRRIIHFKDEYTVQPLEVTNLGGRDTVTGRLVAKGIGGGIKHKYHWIKWIRDGPTDLNEKPKEEKVLAIFSDGCRTSYVALVGSGSELKYILATENMKVGDILKTHKGVPRNPVRANEGDAYPLGALPVGTIVNCVEKYPGLGGFLVHTAGSAATITGHDDKGKVIVEMPSKRKFALDKYCMATIGRLSNVDHANTPIGSPQKNRELGNRPRSGLWQRKSGRHGRKLRKLPPIRAFTENKEENVETFSLNLSGLN